MRVGAEVREPYARQTAARVGGALLITGGALAVVLMVIGPGFVNGKFEITLTVATVALTVGAVCVSVPQRVPAWVLPAIGPLGTVLIALSSILTRTATDGSEMLYLWTVLYSAYFLPLRYALINVVLIAAVYPPIVISIIGSPGVTPAVYVVGTGVVTLLIVSNLRRHLIRLLTESAREARTDGLTGLPNRRSWQEDLDRELAVQARNRAPLSLLAIDIDHFKRLNDTHGHAAGDVALVGLAGVLRAHARQSDVLARVGGEEFALLLPGAAADDARRRAEEIRRAVQETAARWTNPVTISVGVAALPAHARTGEELARAADAALYAAKRSGRNTVCVHRPDRPAGTPPPGVGQRVAGRSG